MNKNTNLQSGWIYPLVDPDRYWDEDDADRYAISPDKRYSYALIPSDLDPGDCYVVDAWISDENGNPHPGYDQCPVPILKEDVDLSRGRKLGAPCPTRQSIFGARA